MFGADLRAATLTWTGAAGDNNVLTAGNWSPAQVPTSADTLTFSPVAALTPQLASSLSVAGFVFSSGDGADTFGGAGTYTIGTGGIVNNSSSTETINNAIKLGVAQTWNSASGALVINGNVDNNAKLLTVSGSAGTTITGIISGTGGLTDTSGLVTLTGANTYSGATTISGGTVVVGNNTAFGTSIVTMSGGTIGSYGAHTLSNALTLSNTVTFAGPDLLTFTGSVADSTGVTLNVPGQVEFDGAFTSGQTVTKAGVGTLTLGGATSNPGYLAINDGTVVMAKTGGALAAGGTASALGYVTVGDATGATGSAVLQVNGTSQMSGYTSLTVNSDGVFNLNNNSQTISQLIMNGGTLQGGGTLTLTSNGLASSSFALRGDVTSTTGPATISSDIILPASAGIRVTGVGGATPDFIFSGNISQPNLFNTFTNATIEFSGQNTFPAMQSGPINWNPTVLIGASSTGSPGSITSGPLGTGTYTMYGGKLLFDTTSGHTIANPILISYAGSYTIGGQNTSGVNTFTGPITLQSSTSPTTNFTAATGGEVDFNGVISWSTYTESINKVGGGTVVFNAVNTYNGTTTVSEGTLKEGVSNAIAAGPLVVNGSTAVFDMGANHTDTVGAVTLTDGTITGSGSSVLTGSGYTTTNGSVNIPLAGTGALTQTTGGTTTLNAVNTYTGITTLNSGGTLALGIDNAISSSSAGVINGTLDLNNHNENIGSITGAGTISLGSGSLTTGSLNTDRTFSGSITGTGGLTKIGTGVLTLSGSSAYTGPTTISAGSITVSASNALPDLSAVSVASGASLIINSGVTDIIGSLSGAGTVTDTGTLAVGADNTSTTFSGAIGSTGSLIKTGTGTQTLTGANTLSGTFKLEEGGLTLSGASGTATSVTGVTIGSGSTFTLDNSAGDNANRISNTAAMTFDGGTFQFISDSNGSTETVGALTPNSGNSAIKITNNGGASDNTTLTFASLATPVAGATVDFSSTSGILGPNTTAGAHILITGPSTGLLGGWATVGSDFAYYDSTYGVQSYANYSTDPLGININDPTKVVLLNSASASGAYTLTHAGITTDYGLKLDDAASVNLGTVTTNSLNLASGGLIKSTSTPTTISGSGYLTAGGTAAGTLDVNVASGSSLTISSVIENNAGTDGIYGNTGDGVVGLAKSNDGLLILSGTNTYTGNNFINAGTVQISSEANLGALANDVALNGGTLNVTAGFIANSGKFFTVGATKTGTLDINASQTLTLATAGALSTGDTYSLLHKAGSGTLLISAANTGFDGILSIDAGTVEVQNASALGDATNRATIDLNGGTLNIHSNTGISLPGNVVVTAASTIDVNHVTTGSALNQTIHSLTLGTSPLTISGGSSYTLTATSVALTDDATINTTTANALFGPVSGTGDLTKTGAGTLTLNGAGTYDGATNVSGGTLKLGIVTAIPDSSAVTVATGATLDNNSLSPTFGSLAGGGSVLLGSGTATVGGLNASTTFSGVISGTGGLIQDGTGTLTLSGVNTYTGDTTISAGSIKLGASNALSDSTDVTIAAGATFDVNGQTDTIGSLAGFGNTSLGSGALTTGADGATTAYTGNISGSGSLTKTGSGTMTVSGNSTYSGGTTVSAGTLDMKNATAIGTGPVSVSSGATLALDPGAGSSLNDSSNALTLNGGTLSNASGSNTWGGSVAVTTSSNINVAPATFLSLTGAITGSGAVNLTGPGALTISSANNTNTGATNVNAGTLVVGATNAISSSSDVTVASGAILNLNGQTDVIGSLAGAGSVQLGSGALTTGGDGASTTFSGTISGTGSVTKDGGGTMTVSSSQSYTGPTTIIAGSLALIGNAALSSSSDLVIGQEATLDVSGHSGGGYMTGAAVTGLGTITGSLTATGIVAPGMPSGSITGTLTTSALTMTSTTQSSFQLAGTSTGSYDHITTVGNLVLDGTVTVSFAGGFTAASLVKGNSFDLFDWTTLNASNFNVATDLMLPSLTGTGLVWDTSQFLVTGVVSIVPEPSRAVLMLAGMAAMALRRRRSQKASGGAWN